MDSIRCQYVDATGETQALPSIGGRGLLSHYFTLEAGEYLIGISGRSGQYVDSIVFHTNQRISPTYWAAVAAMTSPCRRQKAAKWLASSGVPAGLWTPSAL